MTNALVWFRQDLRLTDNPALFAACTNHHKVLPIYILDQENHFLGEAQKWWLHHSLQALQDSLREKLGLKLVLFQGDPLQIIIKLTHSLSIKSVYWNRCYEPLSIARDKKIKALLQENDINTLSFNASLFNEPWTVNNHKKDFFKVFTPYWKKCRPTLIAPPEKELIGNFSTIDIPCAELSDWGLLPFPNWAAQFANLWTPGEAGAQHQLNEFIGGPLQGYKINRNIPAKQATSHLSPHLHFGEISPWAILRALEQAKRDLNCDLAGAENFLSELGWREFSYYLLFHVPTLPEKNFKAEFERFPWRNDASLLNSWQKGMTGYPIVDAGMRELWATGYMHNRVRMISASFLTKGLFIDWRLGAKWFLHTLVDADLANNSASWQWVAGCGVDAAPYFRIFNPVLQSQKFDPEGHYIRRWVPELASLDKKTIHAPWLNANALSIYNNNLYPMPIIDHYEARSQALAYYNQLKKENY